MRYPIVEIFSSIKGEGLWAGEPMLFVRLGTCNAHCHHCDTPYNVIAERLEPSEITARLVALCTELEKVVITGGEPTIHDLDPLIDELTAKGYSLQLETNGSKPISHRFDFVCVSPKLNYVPVDWDEVVNRADEIKFPIMCGADLRLAEDFRTEFLARHEKKRILSVPWKRVVFWLHPWNDLFQWSTAGFLDDVEGARTIKGVSPVNNDLCVQHALKTGYWRVSVQVHKLLQIP